MNDLTEEQKATIAAQKAQFDRDGFVIVRDALSSEQTERLIAAADRLYADGVGRDGLSERRHWQMRNCLPSDPAFLELVAHPNILPLVAAILAWDIHLITSHLIVRPPTPDADAHFKGEGWHRDGGQSSWEMAEPHPRLFLKVAFLLSDQSEPGRGNTQVLPGSNRLVGPPAQAKGAPHPYGALEVLGKPGDALLFEQRTWHAVGPNHSEITRKSVFFGYGFRWVRSMDALTPPTELFPHVSPIERQLLGEVATPMGVYLPMDEDVPLRDWWRRNLA